MTNYVILSLFLGNMLHNLQEVFLKEAKRLQKLAESKMLLKNQVPASQPLFTNTAYTSCDPLYGRFVCRGNSALHHGHSKRFINAVNPPP